MADIPLFGTAYFFSPILFAGLWNMGVTASNFMAMPEASVNKNSNFLLGKDDIGFSGELFVVYPVPVSKREQLLSYKKFNGCILTFYVGHDLAAPFF